MNRYFLAIDLGASGGRHILGHKENGRIITEEIYRFENGMIERDGHLCWDVERLFSEILKGMKCCVQTDRIPGCMAIDTWAVDHVLLNERDEIAGETYGYRDHRTDGIPEEVYRLIPETTLYAHTGIQKQSFNTIFQLYALKVQEPEVFSRVKTMLMLPDYFNFRLTGKKAQEYTNATSTGLVNAETCDWDQEIIGKLGLPADILLKPQMPGTSLGSLLPTIREEVGFDCEVLMTASHDTASAVMALPQTAENTLYISSGTWSLMGVENPEPVTTEASRAANFTNEGGYDHRYRFLKNIMGLWMIQQVRHEWNDAYSFAQLCEMAEAEQSFMSRVKANDARFLAPRNMQEEIRAALRESGQAEPENPGQMAAVIYCSLAEAYAETLNEIEDITGRHFETINIIGGGSKAAYLNKLTADTCKRDVVAGPDEGTAIGNLMAQMIAAGEFSGLKDAREAVRASFDIRTYSQCPQIP